MLEEINNNNNNGQWRDKSLDKIFFIVLLLMSYDLWCGLYLVFYGLCREVLLIYFRVGKVPLVDIKALIYGGLYTLCLMVYLARRNSRCFEGKERSISDFKSLLFHTLLEWRSSFNLFPCSNFLEMLDHCNLGV